MSARSATSARMAAALALNSSEEVEIEDVILGIRVIPALVAGIQRCSGLRRFADGWIPGTRRRDDAYFFPSPGSVGPPASFQALKPPSTWATGLSPMSCAVLAASAERRPPAQKNTNLLSSAKIGLK